jgi:GntR family transcriptional repressor for pyruvate dehydrogenase complex
VKVTPVSSFSLTIVLNTRKLQCSGSLIFYVPDLPLTTVFAPVAAPSTFEHTVERLGTAIRIGILPPGTRLPPERDLAEQLGISRSTLRQALSTLTVSGHLRAVRGRTGGTFVSESPPIASTVPFPLERTRALLDWRMALELGTVQLAAKRATDDQRSALREAADTLPARDEDWAVFRRADAAFHLQLAEAANTDRVVAATTQLQGELSDLLSSVTPTQRTRETCIAQHCEVALAVADGDAARASTAMRSHLERTEQLLDISR